MQMHKSHSKNDLVEMINTMDLPVVFNHANNKKDIQDKIIYLLSDRNTDEKIKNNFYKINTYQDLKVYLNCVNPKKTLSVKEKSDVMKICKHIIQYCKNGELVELSEYYKDIKMIDDDMHYIKQFGDIPSVRRACKLINQFKLEKDRYIPLISPQIQKRLNDKISSQTVLYGKLVVKRGKFKIIFE